MNAPDFPHRRRCTAYRREWARRLIARGNPPGTLVPAYGSPAWCALPESDPARIAAVVLAAEAWAWTRDLLPELPAAVRGDGPSRQGGHTVGDLGFDPLTRPRLTPRPSGGPAAESHDPVRGDGPTRQGEHIDPDLGFDHTPIDPPGNGPVTPGSPDHPGDGPPRQGGHPPDEPPGPGPATPGNQGGQP